MILRNFFVFFNNATYYFKPKTISITIYVLFGDVICPFNISKYGIETVYWVHLNECTLHSQVTINTICKLITSLGSERAQK